MKQIEDDRRKKIKIVILGILTSLTIYFGIDIYIPSLPYIQHSLGTSKTVVQLTIALYTLGAGLSVLFSGPLSDKIGRKPILLSGIVVMLIGSLVCLFAQSGSELLIGRIIQGLGAGSCMGANRAVFTDIFSGKQLSYASSYLGMFVAISPIFAPIVGGYLEHYYSWRANFVVLSISYSLLSLCLLFFFEETIKQKHQEKLTLKFVLSRYFYLIKQADFRTFAVCAGIALGVPIAYATAGPFILQNTLHMSPIAFGWVGIFIGAGSIIGKLFTPHLVKRFNMQPTLVIGLIVIAISGFALSISYALGWLSISLIVVTVSIALLGQTMAVSNAFALALTEHRHMGGSANALMSSSQMGIAFVIGALISSASHHMPETYALSGTYILIGVLCLGLYFHYKHQQLIRNYQLSQ